MLIWGFFVSTVALLHGTCTINSLSHVYGSQRYKTGDDSKNNFFLAMITLGEGWHNNHHYYAASTRQGFYWWEIDITYYMLRGLQAVGLIWDIRKYPRTCGKARINSLSQEQAGARARLSTALHPFRLIGRFGLYSPTRETSRSRICRLMESISAISCSVAIHASSGSSSMR